MVTPSAEAPLAAAAATPRVVDVLAHRADLLLADADSAISPELSDLATRAIGLETTELEPTSRGTYQYLARDYERFCAGHGFDTFASSSVRLSRRPGRRGRARATLNNRINAIGRVALEAGRPDPTDDLGVRKAAQGSGESATDPRPRRVAPATYETLAMLLNASEAIAGDRARPQLKKKTDAAAILLLDRALVLLGFALGRRGSELARVDLEHIEWRPDGLLIKIRTRRPTSRASPRSSACRNSICDPLWPAAALAAWVTTRKSPREWYS